MNRRTWNRLAAPAWGGSMARRIVPENRQRQHVSADGVITRLNQPLSMSAIKQLIGADTLDTVQLRHLGEPPFVMVLDDAGHAKGLPVNAMATALYHANCVPGTTHQIRGDVVLAPDSDFGGPL